MRLILTPSGMGIRLAMLALLIVLATTGQQPNDEDTMTQPPEENAPQQVASPYPGAPDGGPLGQAPLVSRPAERRNGFGLTALILGIIGLILAFAIIGLIPALLALIFGIVGIRRVSRGIATNRGVAITGVVLGVLGIAISGAILGFVLHRYNSCHDKYETRSSGFVHCIRGDSGY